MKELFVDEMFDIEIMQPGWTINQYRSKIHILREEKWR